MSENKKINRLKIAAVIFAVIFVVFAVLFAVNVWERYRGKYVDGTFDASADTVVYNGTEYVLKDGLETVLVMGLDKFEGSAESDSFYNDRQADFMMLLVIDNNDRECKVLHINRDTMAEMNILGVAGDKVGSVTKQIALSHTYGDGKEVSCRNVANSVSKLLLGVEIDHYVSVTMDAVSVYTELLGGVEVTVLDDFTGIDDTLIQGQKVNLQGEQALTYVRTRKGLDDATNENRMVRQRQFIESIYEKSSAKAKEDDSFISDAALKISSYTVSDCSVNRLQSIFEKVSDYEFAGSYAIDGESVKGEVFMEFYADEDSIKNTVIDLFYDEK